MHKYVNWAFAQPIQGAGRKFILVALADAANGDGYSYPGQDSLAALTGQAQRSVREHLEWLEAQGFVRRKERRRKDGTRTSDAYFLPPVDSTGGINLWPSTGNIRRLQDEPETRDQDGDTPAPTTGKSRRLSAPRSTGKIRTSHRQISPLDANPPSDPSSASKTPTYQPAESAGHEPLTVSRTNTPLPPKGGSGAKAPRRSRGSKKSPKHHEFNPHDPELELPDNFDRDLFADFCARLLEIGKPMTLLALRHFIDAHRSHPQSTLDEMFRRSIRAGWPDIYPIDALKQGKAQPPTPRTAEGDWRELLRVHKTGRWDATTLSEPGKHALRAIGSWAAINQTDTPQDLEQLHQAFLQHHTLSTTELEETAA